MGIDDCGVEVVNCAGDIEARADDGNKWAVYILFGRVVVCYLLFDREVVVSRMGRAYRQREGHPIRICVFDVCPGFVRDLVPVSPSVTHILIGTGQGTTDLGDR